MKHLIFAFICLLGLSAGAQAQGTPKGKERDDLKKVFVESCMKDGANGVTDPIVIGHMKTYCNCSAERVLDKMTPAQLAAIESMTQEEIEKKMTPIVKPCLDILEKTLKEYYNKK